MIGPGKYDEPRKKTNMTITKLTTSIRAAVIAYVKKVTREIREPISPVSERGRKCMAAIDKHFSGNTEFRRQLADILGVVLGEPLEQVAPIKKQGAMYARLTGDHKDMPFWWYHTSCDPVLASGAGIAWRDYRIATDEEIDKFFAAVKDTYIMGRVCAGSTPETLYEKIFVESVPAAEIQAAKQ